MFYISTYKNRVEIVNPYYIERMKTHLADAGIEARESEPIRMRHLHRIMTADACSCKSDVILAQNGVANSDAKSVGLDSTRSACK